MGAEWYEDRYENAVLRNGINTLGLAKLKYDPALSNLPEAAVEDHKALLTLNEAEKICLSNSQLSNIDIANLFKKVAKGKDANKEIWKYYVYLITCNNPGSKDESVKPFTRLCRNSFESAAQNLEADYVDFVSSVQRHSMCNSA